MILTSIVGAILVWSGDIRYHYQHFFTWCLKINLAEDPWTVRLELNGGNTRGGLLHADMDNIFERWMSKDGHCYSECHNWTWSRWLERSPGGEVVAFFSSWNERWVQTAVIAWRTGRREKISRSSEFLHCYRSESCSQGGAHGSTALWPAWSCSWGEVVWDSVPTTGCIEVA